MHCTKKITHDLTWVGGNDHRIRLFEAVYEVHQGMSYNAYLLQDDVTVLFDTVDKAVSKVFFENLEHELAGRTLDYVVVHHMEPDHSATLEELVLRYPGITIVCNAMTATMIEQFFHQDWKDRMYIVKEASTLKTKHHEIQFLMAPMIHWPEVMMSYESTDKILFSADAFGSFGALQGAMFEDEIDFDQAYMDETRRYYCNIIGKYGAQVQALLKKISQLEIQMICPLHGYVWKRRVGDILEKYQRWSTYTPEKPGVVVAYGSVYGNTASVAEGIACRLRDQGVPVVLFDVSMTPASHIVAAAFKWSHLVFLSTTYNAGIFIRMEELLHDLSAHHMQNRTVALVENGSWAATSGKLMRVIVTGWKKCTILDKTISIKSSIKETQLPEVDALVSQLVESIASTTEQNAVGNTEPVKEDLTQIQNEALFKISYGLFVVSTKVEDKENGCIINTAQLVTNSPNRISVTVNKQNYTHDMIQTSGIFNLSVLAESVSFETIKQFGFQSGRDADKFKDTKAAKSSNGLLYITENANAFISGKVEQVIDCDTHSIFIAKVTEAKQLTAENSVTYQYYFDHIKPKPEEPKENKKGFICKICGYVYEAEELPPEYICPICKHGAEDFESLSGSNVLLNI